MTRPSTNDVFTLDLLVRNPLSLEGVPLLVLIGKGRHSPSCKPITTSSRSIHSPTTHFPLLSCRRKGTLLLTQTKNKQSIMKGYTRVCIKISKTIIDIWGTLGVWKTDLNRNEYRQRNKFKYLYLWIYTVSVYVRIPWTPRSE